MKHKLFMPVVALAVLVLLVVGNKSIFALPAEELVEDSAIVKLTADNYEAETAKGIVLVDFWAAWCGPCRKMNPILEATAKEYKGVATIAKLNIDDHKSIAVKLGISSIPTIVVYKDGKEVDRIVGVVPQTHLAKAIAAHGGVKK